MGYIAIVEDEPDILKLVSVSLEKFGFAVKGFLNSDSFLKSAAISKPDLVILDLMLPDMDGFEVCKHLKSREDNRNIPDEILKKCVTGQGQFAEGRLYAHCGMRVVNIV